MTRNRRRHWNRRRPLRMFARQLWAIRHDVPLDAATIRTLANVAKRQRDIADGPPCHRRDWQHWHETYLWLQHEATRAEDAARRTPGGGVR